MPEKVEIEVKDLNFYYSGDKPVDIQERRYGINRPFRLREDDTPSMFQPAARPLSQEQVRRRDTVSGQEHTLEGNRPHRP